MYSINWFHHVKTAEERLWQISLSKENKNDPDGQAKRVNDDKKMDVHEFKWKECVKWSRSGFLSAKPVQTMGAFVQYGPFVYSAFVMATRPEILDCSSYVTTANKQRCVLYCCCHSSQRGRSSDAYCSANKGGDNWSLICCSIWRLWLSGWCWGTFKSYSAILLLPRVIGWDATS